MRCSFPIGGKIKWAPRSLETLVNFPAGWFYFSLFWILQNQDDSCRKGMVPSLTSELVAGQNDKINYQILSFGEMGDNCSDQFSSHPTPCPGFPPVEVTYMFTWNKWQISFSGFYGKLRSWNNRLTQVVSKNFHEIYTLFGNVMVW